MGYSGYREYICPEGHYTTASVYDDFPDRCPVCESEFTHWNSVDVTNGEDPDEPYSMPAPKRVIGSYQKVITIDLYEPISGWTKQGENKLT